MDISNLIGAEDSTSIASAISNKVSTFKDLSNKVNEFYSKQMHDTFNTQKSNNENPSSLSYKERINNYLSSSTNIIEKINAQISKPLHFSNDAASILILNKLRSMKNSSRLSPLSEANLLHNKIRESKPISVLPGKTSFYEPIEIIKRVNDSFNLLKIKTPTTLFMPHHKVLIVSGVNS